MAIFLFVGLSFCYVPSFKSSSYVKDANSSFSLHFLTLFMIFFNTEVHFYVSSPNILIHVLSILSVFSLLFWFQSSVYTVLDGAFNTTTLMESMNYA